MCSFLDVIAFPTLTINLPACRRVAYFQSKISLQSSRRLEFSLFNEKVEASPLR